MNSLCFLCKLNISSLARNTAAFKLVTTLLGDSKFDNLRNLSKQQ